MAPSDSYQKIEAAKAGDEVVIASGTYKFRVHLTQVGTADQPIVIRALDPAQPPVWDLANTLVEDAPGSYTAGDRGRGCWQVSGGKYYDISGIVFTNCHNASENAAGMRYYNGARGIRLRDCVFRGNDNGLTGGTGSSEITVEYCEFDANGNTAASAPTHNLYIYGGTFTLRYAYVHDPLQGQNFHIRAANAVLEYNWFARAKSYEGDLMTDDDASGPSAVAPDHAPARQRARPGGATGNNSQVIAVYNDAEIEGRAFSVRLINNTFVGNGGRAALVHLSNADSSIMGAELLEQHRGGHVGGHAGRGRCQRHRPRLEQLDPDGRQRRRPVGQHRRQRPGFRQPGGQGLHAGGRQSAPSARRRPGTSCPAPSTTGTSRCRGCAGSAPAQGPRRVREHDDRGAHRSLRSGDARARRRTRHGGHRRAGRRCASGWRGGAGGSGGATGRRDASSGTGGATLIDGGVLDGGRGTGGAGGGGTGGTRTVVPDAGVVSDGRPVASGGAVGSGGATAAGGATGAGARGRPVGTGTGAAGGAAGGQQTGGLIRLWLRPRPRAARSVVAARPGGGDLARAKARVAADAGDS